MVASMKLPLLCFAAWMFLGATIPPEPDQYSYEQAKPYADYDSDILELKEQIMRYQQRAEEYRSIADSLRGDSPQEADHYDRMAEAYERRAMRASFQLRKLARENPEEVVDIQPYKHLWEEQLPVRDQDRARPQRDRQEQRLRDDSWHYLE
jgi:cell division septum initiation protein DivIVA